MIDELVKEAEEKCAQIFKQIDEALHYLNLVNRIRAEIVGFKRVDTKRRAFRNSPQKAFSMIIQNST